MSEAEGPDDVGAALAALGDAADADVDVAEAALLLAAFGQPTPALERYRRHLDKLVADARAYAGPEPALPLMEETLRQVLARRYGYGPVDDDDATDADGANMIRVVDRRAGRPVMIGILYLHVARRLGWAADGLDFPPRFLVRLQHEGARVILDPAAGGVAVSAPEMRQLYKARAGNDAELTPGAYRAMTNREILMRVHAHVHRHLVRAGRLDQALAAADAMIRLAPGEPALWREVGLLHARLDHVREAVAALEEYLRNTDADPGHQRTSMLLQELRQRLS